jgi:AraC family transcriptional regulator
VPVDNVPATWGSPRSLRSDADGFLVTSAYFPGGSDLPRHTHERATLAVVLRGSFEQSARGGTHPCPPSTVLVEPAGEPHGNRFDPTGAEVLIVQPDPADRELLDPFRRVLDESGQDRDPGVAALATRAVGEMRAWDDISPIAVTGLVLEILARTARLRLPARAGPRPRWLTQARDVLHDRFAEPLRVSEVAGAVGVHPVHLSRVFSAEFGMPVSAYLRCLRVDWAAGRLATSDEPIARIAARAGFTDQSHLTRAFRARLGVTPLEWRRSSRR